MLKKDSFIYVFIFLTIFKDTGEAIMSYDPDTAELGAGIKALHRCPPMLL